MIDEALTNQLSFKLHGNIEGLKNSFINKCLTGFFWFFWTTEKNQFAHLTIVILHLLMFCTMHSEKE